MLCSRLAGGALRVAAAWQLAPAPATASRRGAAAAAPGRGGEDPLGADDRTGAARDVVEDFRQAAEDSVRGAARGEVGSVVKGATRMASSAARGAAESARLVMDSLVGGGGYGEPATGKGRGAGAEGGEAAGGPAFTRAMGASTGPESTYSGHSLRDATTFQHAAYAAGEAPATGPGAGPLAADAPPTGYPRADAPGVQYGSFGHEAIGDENWSGLINSTEPPAEEENTSWGGFATPHGVAGSVDRSGGGAAPGGQNVGTGTNMGRGPSGASRDTV